MTANADSAWLTAMARKTHPTALRGRFAAITRPADAKTMDSTALPTDWLAPTAAMCQWGKSKAIAATEEVRQTPQTAQASRRSADEGRSPFGTGLAAGNPFIRAPPPRQRDRGPGPGPARLP